MGRFALGGDPRPLEEKERLRLVRRAECIQDMIMSLEYREIIKQMELLQPLYNILKKYKRFLRQCSITYILSNYSAL